MPAAKHEQALRRAVLQLSRHGDADIGAVLARLDAPQRDRLRELLAELGGAKASSAAPRTQDEAAPERQLRAFVRSIPPPFAERFEAALIESGKLRHAGSAISAHPHRMTDRTSAVVAEAIARHVSTSAPQPHDPQPRRPSLLTRWFGRRARP